MNKKRILIVGGVAGGANVAARLRRLDEHSEVAMYERGGYVSFANCGLPYHIGGEIENRSKLLIHTPESLKRRFAIDVHIRSEVISINRAEQTIRVRNLQTGDEYVDRYDNLVLSPGATPFRPKIEGLDLPGVFSLRDIDDMDAIIARLTSQPPKSITVVGGGFIGLEMVEQLFHRLSMEGVKLRVLESNPQLLTPLDPEMTLEIVGELESKGIELHFGDPVTAFESADGRIVTLTRNNKRYESDLVLFNIGVRPEVSLAKDCGLELGARGGIKVDNQLRTSDPKIFALGDCIETEHLVTKEYGLIPLAGPANRQGRIVADVISGLDSKYKGTLGTAILRVFNTTAAVTGANEKTLRRLGLPYQAIYLHPGSHAGYYPGAHKIHLKLLFSSETGKILGAQAVGRDGVDKRIDLIATAIYAGLTVDDLTELELNYAPPFSSAKDPVNLAGMIGQNIQNGLVETVSPIDLPAEKGEILLLDVRDGAEREKGFIPASIHIPLSELRERLPSLPKDKLIIAYCQTGQRSYNACRILSQHGYRCKNLNGAYSTWVQSTGKTEPFLHPTD